MVAEIGEMAEKYLRIEAVTDLPGLRVKLAMDAMTDEAIVTRKILLRSLSLNEHPNTQI